MSLISLVVTLIVIGVLLWALNTLGGPYIDAKILKIINVLVIVCVVLWLVATFLGGGHVQDVRVPTLR